MRELAWTISPTKIKVETKICAKDSPLTANVNSRRLPSRGELGNQHPWRPNAGLGNHMTPCTRNAATGKVLDRLGWRGADFFMEAQGRNPTAAMWPAHFSEKLPDGREALHLSCVSKGDVSSNIACQQLFLQCGPLLGFVVGINGNAKTVWPG